MQKLFEILPIVSSTDSTVLIEEASGIGKELGIDVSTLFRKSKSLRISLPEKNGRHRRE
jgi:transcriptional regulator with GAF, ATPase, and Fis domain